MNNNTDRLKQIMRERNLSAGDVGALLNRSPRTVYQWRSEAPPIPPHMLELLELKSAGIVAGVEP